MVSQNYNMINQYVTSLACVNVRAIFCQGQLILLYKS